VGGLLLAKFWWGSVFLINVPIIAGGVVAVLLVVPESRNPNPGRIDVVGVMLSIAGLVALVYGIIQGGESGAWSRWDVGGAFLAGVVILTAFVLWELRIDHPSVDVRLFRNPRLSSAGVAIGTVFFAPMGVFFFLAFYLQGIRDYTPLQSGLLMLPFAVSQVLFAPRSAALVKRFGLRAVCTSGLGLVAVSSATYASVGDATPIAVVLVALFLSGTGLAVVMPPATESFIAHMRRERAGTGSAVANTIRQVGGALGVAIVGSLLTAVYRMQLEPALVGLGPKAAVARESVTAAHGVAAGAGVPQLAEAADAAFVSAVHVASLGAAAVALLGAVAVFVGMRSPADASHPPAAHGAERPPPRVAVPPVHRPGLPDRSPPGASRPLSTSTTTVPNEVSHGQHQPPDPARRHAARGPLPHRPRALVGQLPHEAPVRPGPRVRDDGRRER